MEVTKEHLTGEDLRWVAGAVAAPDHARSTYLGRIYVDCAPDWVRLVATDSYRLHSVKVAGGADFEPFTLDADAVRRAVGSAEKSMGYRGSIDAGGLLFQGARIEPMPVPVNWKNIDEIVAPYADVPRWLSVDEPTRHLARYLGGMSKKVTKHKPLVTFREAGEVLEVVLGKGSDDERGLIATANAQFAGQALAGASEFGVTESALRPMRLRAPGRDALLMPVKR